MLLSRLTIAPIGFMMLAATAHATTIYSNLTNFTGSVFPPGGATVVSGSDFTNMAADDITVAPGYAGSTVTSLTYAIGNTGPSSVTFEVVIGVYDNNGTGGGPGTLLGFMIDTSVTLAAASANEFTVDVNNAALFTVPANGTFWVGIAFNDAGGTTGATAAQLDDLGPALFNPPTIGTSQDEFFVSTSPGFPTNNPVGNIVNFGGSPVANFGWSFDAQTPEPGTALLTFLAAIPLAAVLIRRRRNPPGER